MPHKFIAGRALTIEERQQLQLFANTPMSASKIARMIGRSKNCVNSEYRRAGGRANYTAVKGEEIFLRNKEIRKQKITYPISERLRTIIKTGNKEGWSLRKMEEETGVDKKRIHRYLEKIQAQPFNESLLSRVESLEMQLDIVLDVLKQLKIEKG